MNIPPGVIALRVGGELLRFRPEHIIRYGKHPVQAVGSRVITVDCADEEFIAVMETPEEIDAKIIEASPNVSELGVSESATCCCCNELQPLHQTLAELRVELRNR